MNQIRILHLTGDYPDPVRKPTTQAIKHTIDHLPQFEHVVISLDRTPNPMKTYWKNCGCIGETQVFAHGQWGLPLGIGLYSSFYLTARRVWREMNAIGFKPDVIHAHRLTFDGIAAWLLARWWNIPFVASVRGEVESKVFRFKPFYRPFLTRMVNDAQVIYYVSLWFRKDLRRFTGVREDKERPFPNIVLNTTKVIETAPATRGFVSIFNFAIHKKKGLGRLLPAFKAALEQQPEITLDLIGQSTQQELKIIQALIDDHGLSQSVNAIGPLPNKEVVKRLPDYHALLLPSHNETFGMVYTEALFAGIPVLYSAGNGIDGFLDGLNVGARVDPKNTEAIRDGILHLWENNNSLRQTIRDNGQELYSRFNPSFHLKGYEADMKRLTSGRHTSK